MGKDSVFLKKMKQRQLWLQLLLGVWLLLLLVLIWRFFTNMTWSTGFTLVAAGVFLTTIWTMLSTIKEGIKNYHSRWPD